MELGVVVHTSVPAPGRLRQKDSEFEVSLSHTEFQARLSHIERPSVMKRKKARERKEGKNY